MASGIDWFRWHHGSVSDPKFQLIAKKSQSSVAEVIAVWAFVLESSSSSEKRGDHGFLDFESIDCALGIEEGKSAVIYYQMEQRGLVEKNRVSSWDKRQPKRERPDDNSAPRVDALRVRNSATEANTAIQNHVTPSNANEEQKTPREEESREEVNHGSVKPPRKKATALPADFYPNETGVAYAEEKRISLAVELESFRNWHTAKGGTFKDWQACWRTWCDKAVEFGRAGKAISPAASAPGALPDFMRGAL